MKTRESGLPKKAIQELRVLYKSKKGMLTPEDVLQRARVRSSALHSYFEWDDTEAARKYRLEQARGVIRTVRVHIERVDVPEIKVRAYVSLPSDRNTTTGYRHISLVMATPAQRNELLAVALAEFEALRKRYADLTELAGVFEAIEKAAKNTKPMKRPRKKP